MADASEAAERFAVRMITDAECVRRRWRASDWLKVEAHEVTSRFKCVSRFTCLGCGSVNSLDPPVDLKKMTVLLCGNCSDLTQVTRRE